MDRILIFFTILILCYSCLFYNQKLDHYNEFEYHQILDGDSIIIESDLGQCDTIHADSLDSYLIQQNL
jgi:hypothetical protein